MLDFFTFQKITIFNLIVLSVLVLFDLFQFSKFSYLIFLRRSKKKTKVISIPGLTNVKRLNRFEKWSKRILIWVKRWTSYRYYAKKGLVIKKRKRYLDFKFVYRSFFIISSINVIGLLIIGGLFYLVFNLKPDVVAVYPAANQQWEDLANPIELEFNTPIQKSDLEVKFSDTFEGEWDFSSFRLGSREFIISARYQPEISVMPGEEIKLELRNIRNMFDVQGDKKILLYTFRAAPPNDVADMNVWDDGRDVELDRILEFGFERDLLGYTDWEFEIDKNIPFETRVEKKKIYLEFKELLEMDQEYTLSINRTIQTVRTATNEIVAMQDKERLHVLTFYTAKQPQVSYFWPQYTALPEDTIQIKFDQEMDQNSVEEKFSLTPEMKGDFVWADNWTLIFYPSEDFVKGEQYVVNFDDGVVSTKKAYTITPYSFNFSGIGEVQVADWNPKNEDGLISLDTDIEVVFDQKVNQSSAEELLSISPSLEGEISWKDNVLIFTPSEKLDKETEYTIRIDSGVQSILGDDSVQDFEHFFTTKGDSFVLDVPLHHQTHRYTCNVTAARMILDFKGIEKSEMDVYNELPKDDTPCDPINGVWGDPHQGFVGNIDGNKVGGCLSSDGKSAYGIYWEPVSEYFQGLGLKTEIKQKWSIEELAEEISKGHPAILWWQNGAWSPTDKSWVTPEGKEIYAINGMHSEIAIGFVGEVDNPSHIIVLDPWRGKRKLSREYVEKTWKWFDETAVVIY